MISKILFKPASCVAVFFAVTLSSPITAQESATAAFAEMLSLVPQNTIESSSSLMEIEFGDVSVLSPFLALGALQGRNPQQVERLAVAQSMPGSIRQSMMVADEDLMFEAVGLRHADFSQTLSLSALPSEIVLMRVQDTAISSVDAALTANGYSRTVEMGVPVLWSNEIDYAIDLDAIDRNNPFSGRLGRASRFALAPGLLAYSLGWPEMTRLLSPGPVLSDHPDIQAALSATDAALEPPRRVGHAYLAMPPAGGSQGATVDPLLGLDQSVGLSLVAISAVPFMTDETGLMALVFAEGTNIDAMAERIAENWANADDPVMQRPFARDGEPMPIINAVPGERPVVTLELTQDWGEDGAMANQPQTRLLQMVFRGSIPALLNE